MKEKTIRRNMQTKTALVQMFSSIVMSEIMSGMFGGIRKTNSDEYLNRAIRLDVREKGFKEKALEIMIEYFGYLSQFVQKPMEP